MSKNIIILGLFVTMVSTALCVSAEPIMINDLGGLYLMNNREERLINVPEEKASTEKAKESAIKIKETAGESVVPVSDTTYSFERGSVDTSKSNGYVDLPSSGVNASKTIYTDDLGRLHFFGKGNLIKGERKVYTTESEE
ncbi:MAG: hypothetical protein MJ231_08795 [bacterium]|nr:hypothetical protein [bacterium]